ncbi:MAG: hypothetical protein K2G32_03975 [Oscillospiraceae bacterium]|nr:hypothetical protein [Oscillospiraceae bacterium]
MKKHAMIVLSLLLLTGCANSRESNPAEALPETEIAETSEQVSESTEEVKQPAAPTSSTAKAIDHLYRNVNGYKRPNNFAGAHTVDGTLMIMITDDDQTPYDFMSEFDCVSFEQVEYSLNELENILRVGIPQKILLENEIIWVNVGVETSSNSIQIDVYDEGYTDTQKSEIASFVEDYPVTIKYVDYHW